MPLTFTCLDLYPPNADIYKGLFYPPLHRCISYLPEEKLFSCDRVVEYVDHVPVHGAENGPMGHQSTAQVTVSLQNNDDMHACMHFTLFYFSKKLFSIFAFLHFSFSDKFKKGSGFWMAVIKS